MLFSCEVQCANCSSTNTRSARGLFAPCRVQPSNPTNRTAHQAARISTTAFIAAMDIRKLVIAHQFPIDTCLSQSASLSQQRVAISTSSLADNELNKPQPATQPTRNLKISNRSSALTPQCAVALLSTSRKASLSAANRSVTIRRRTALREALPLWL